MKFGSRQFSRFVSNKKNIFLSGGSTKEKFFLKRCCVFSVFLILSLNLNMLAQVVIINPVAVLSDYPTPQYTPCGPWPPREGTDYYNPRQVIWNSISIWIDPYQQFFNNQQNLYNNYALNAAHYYNVSIEQGVEYCYIEKQLFDPVTEV